MSNHAHHKNWRSLLYLPANNERFLSKALSRGADALILDLEDSIAIAEKDNARERCKTAIAELAGHGTDITVRINAPLRLAVRDLEAVIQKGLTAVVIPKVETAGGLRLFDELISELENERNLEQGSIGILPILESPQALFHAHDVATASKRNMSLLFGGEDFANECDMVSSGGTLDMYSLQVALAAKAAGLPALGMLGDGIAHIDDHQVYLDNAKRSAKFGFTGSSCIHPLLVPLLNEAFSPSDAEIAQAQRIVDGMEQSLAKGEGATLVDGMMIDKPVYERALKVLARAPKK